MIHVNGINTKAIYQQNKKKNEHNTKHGVKQDTVTVTAGDFEP